MSRFLARRPPPTPSERWAAARAGDYRAVVGAGNVVPSMSTPPDRRAAAGTAGTEADAGADDLVALVAEGDALLAKMERVHSSADATRALHPTEQPMPQTVVPGSEASIAHVHSHGHASSYDTHGSGGSHGHQHTHLDGTSHDHPHLHDHEHHDLHAHPETLFHPDHLVRAGGGGAAADRPARFTRDPLRQSETLPR